MGQWEGELVIFLFVMQLSFNLPKLDVKFVYRLHHLVVQNNIMDIKLESIKSRYIEDVGESTRLDILMNFSEIHVRMQLSMDFKIFLGL